MGRFDILLRPRKMERPFNPNTFPLARPFSSKRHLIATWAGRNQKKRNGDGYLFDFADKSQSSYQRAQGDVHSLLHQHGLSKRWAEEGRQWLFVFQDGLQTCQPSLWMHKLHFAEVVRCCVPVFIGFRPSQVVQEFAIHGMSGFP